MHYQADPHAEDKLVRCTAGAIFDVIVDLRPRSPTERRWFGIELTARNRRSLFVPKGFAHGFITLADDSEVLYMMSAAYAPGFGRGVRWNDPAFGIEWPIEPTLIAERDAAYPLLAAAPRRLNADRRVLVTGAGGFIGRHSLEPLIGRGVRRARGVRRRAAARSITAAERESHGAPRRSDDRMRASTR